MKNYRIQNHLDPVAVPVAVPVAPREDIDPPTQSEPKTEVKKVIDRGKILALNKAGWKMKDIAEEVGASIASVCKVIREGE
ncbi:MAG: helix-turn-helix domain-containing protein [Lachnospiraceae bacterium]